MLTEKFIERAKKLHGGRYNYDISTNLNNLSNLRRGDILLYVGSHVRLFLYKSDELFYTIESAGGNADKVLLFQYSLADLSNYSPYRYIQKVNYDLDYINFNISTDQITTGEPLEISLDIHNKGVESIISNFSLAFYNSNDELKFYTSSQEKLIDYNSSENFVFLIDEIPTELEPGDYKIYVRFVKDGIYLSTVPKFNYQGPEEVEVLAPSLQANFSFSPPMGPPGVQIVFNNQSTGNINYVSWSISQLYGLGGVATFENGTSASSFNPIVNFGQSGDVGDIYIVELYVSEDGIYWVSETKTIPICEGNKSCNDPTVDFYATINGIATTQVTAGQEVMFHDNSSFNAIGWVWEFPNGVCNNPYYDKPSVTYYSPGIYDVTLYAITEEVSCPVPCKSVSGYIEVLDYSGGPLMADFSFDPTSIIEGTQVTFYSTSTGTTDNTIYEWTFEDGTP